MSLLVVSRKDFKRKTKETLCRIIKVDRYGSELSTVPYNKTKDEWLLPNFDDGANYDLITEYNIYHLRYGKIIESKNRKIPLKFLI